METVEERARRGDEGVRRLAVAKEGPPHPEPSARPQGCQELREPDGLVHPVEARRGDGEIEVARRQLRVLERDHPDVDTSVFPDIRRERRIGLDRDDRRSSLEQPSRRLTRPGPDLEHS